MPTEEQVNPNSWGNRLEQGTAASSRSSRAALRRTASSKMYTKYRSRIPVRVSRMASPGMQRPSQRPTAPQDWARSVPVSAPLGEQDPAQPGQTEPPQDLETRSQVGSRPSHESRVAHRSRIPVPVSRGVSTGIHRPSQRLVPQRDWARGMPASASLDKQGPAPALLWETEPAQLLKPRRPVGSRASHHAYLKYRSRIPVPVSRGVSTGLQKPSQRPTAEQQRAQGTPVPAGPGSLPGTWCCRQELEQEPAESCAQIGRQHLSGTSLPMPAKTAESQSTLSRGEPLQELNARCSAHAEHRLPPLREASPVLQELEEISHYQTLLDWLEANFPKLEEDKRHQELSQRQHDKDEEPSQGEEDNTEELSAGEDSTDEGPSQGDQEKDEERSQGQGSKDLSQGENDISCNLWDNSLGPVSERDPDIAAQEVLSSLSTLGPEAAAEAVAELPSTAPATAGATGSQPQAAAAARAAEAQEEEATAASPAFGEQLRAAEAESQAAALHSPCSPASPSPNWPEARGPSGPQPARRQPPSRFRRALRALITLCRCSCVGARTED